MFVDIHEVREGWDVEACRGGADATALIETSGAPRNGGCASM
jgi:hypothetical protein